MAIDESNDGSRIHFLHKEIHSMSQGTLTVSNYFSRFRECWDEFDAIMPCPSCNCPESRNYIQHFDYQRLFQFLTGLNESYAPNRSQILMMTPTPSINQVYSMVISEESQRSLGKLVQNLDTNEGAAFYTSKGNFKPNPGGGEVQFRPTSSQGHTGHTRSGYYTGSSSNSGSGNSGNASSSGTKNRKNSHLQCDYCHYTGHTSDRCYQLHGYPPDFRQNSKKKFNSHSTSSSGHGDAVNFASEHDTSSDMDGYSGSSGNALGATSSNPTGAYVHQSRSSQITHPSAPHFIPE